MKKCIKFIVLLLVIVLCVMCIRAFACSVEEDYIYYIFSDITECQNLVSNKHKDATVNLYDLPNDDDYVEELSYARFWGCEYTSSDMSFEIFAYEFANKEASKAYFENATGDQPDQDVIFRQSGGLFSSELIVVDGANAYCLRAATSEIEQVKAFLEQQFTRKLDFNK